MTEFTFETTAIENEGGGFISRKQYFIFVDEWGGEKASGILLHAKFLDTFTEKAAEELQRKQHYAASIEYLAYAKAIKENPELWCKWSEKYINWRQLEILGLMSKGNWA